MQLDWIYVLVQMQDKFFKWCVFDFYFLWWYDLFLLLYDMEFQFFNLGCIGVFYIVQCVSMSFKFVMIVGVKVRKDGQFWMIVEFVFDYFYIFDICMSFWK